MAGRLLFSFGVIADVQYADIDDRQNFNKTIWRHYREALSGLKQAVAFWNDKSPTKVSFVLQLGDIIDGFNTETNSSQVALETVLKAFEAFSGPVHHTLGNHELYNFTHAQLLHSDLNSSPLENQEQKNSVERKGYYFFSPHKNFLIVMLDTYEISVLGYDKEHPAYKEGIALLNSKNPNAVKNSPVGLRGTDRRFCAFNGGLCKEQLEWLDTVLTKADKDKQHVVVVGMCKFYWGL